MNTIAARLFILWATLLSLMLLTSCATTRVSEVPAGAIDWTQVQRYAGHVEYSGNPAYLPKMLVASSTGERATQGTLFRYAYDVSYHVPREHVLTLFNPLLLVGASKSSDAIIVSGTLEILRGGVELTRYAKTVTLSKDKTLFSEGDTLSEMRRQGLLMVRDAIDQQILADEAFLRMRLVENMR